MAGVAKSIFIGRLTRDPEFKKVQIRGEETSVVNFTIAVDKEVGEGADFYNIVAWRGLADTVARFLTKGRLVYVEGRPTTRSYDVVKEGVTFQNYVTEYHATKVEFLDRAQSQDAPATTPPATTYTAPSAPQTQEVPW